jgi:hypothetical protein
MFFEMYFCTQLAHMLRPFYLLFYLCFITVQLKAQKQSVITEQVWLGNTNQVRMSQHFGASADFQVRSKEYFTRGVSQFNFRLGAVYYFTDAVRLAAGYAFVENFLGDNSNRIHLFEHSPWEQISWSNKYNRFSINQSIRLEERFRQSVQNNVKQNAFGFNYRTRYNMLLSYALSKHPTAVGALDAVGYNEVYLNFGKQVVYNSFDQYRVFGGLNYHLGRFSSLQFGYVHSFQQLAAGNRYRKLHMARVFYLYNLDLRTKHPKTKTPQDVSCVSTAALVVC